MTSDRPLKLLGELVDNFDSARVPVKESERKPGPYPYYGASGIVDYVDGYLFDGEYLLIAEDGENLRTRQTPIAFMATGRFWVNNHAHIVRGNTENDTRYLMYALRVAEVAAYLTGSAMPKLTQANMNRIPVVAPLLTEQSAIAHVLGSLDDKIELSQRMNSTLEALARAVFHAWFVDFEPIKAKAAGATSFPGMPQSVFDRLPTEFVEGEFGPIPAGWQIGCLDDTAELSKDQVNPQECPDELFDHFSIPAFDADRRPTVEPGSAIKSNKFLVAEQCVLWSKLNPRIPRIWLPPSASANRQIASTEFLVLVPRPGWDRNYLFCQLRDPEFRDSIGQSASGTSNSHQRVRPQDLLAKRIIVSPPELRRAFFMIVEPMFAKCGCIHAESGTLAAIRDAMLPKLISGEVRVPPIARDRDG